MTCLPHGLYGPQLAAFIKESIIHWSTQHMKALGHMVSEKIFLCFSHDTPGVGPAWTPGAWLAGFVAGFIKRTTLHTQNMKALGLVVSEKRIFQRFSHDAPEAGPVWTPGAWLAGFIKRTTIHCYKQNMKALGLVVSEEKIFLCFTHDPPPPPPPPPRLGGAQMDPRGMAGRIYKEDQYTLLKI